MLKRIVGKFYKSDPSPTPQMPKEHKPEVIFTDKRQVVCAGPSFSNHPKVWLKVPEEEGQVFCPYCSRLFKLR